MNDFKKTLKSARKLRDSLDMTQYQLVEMHDRSVSERERERGSDTTLARGITFVIYVNLFPFVEMMDSGNNIRRSVCVFVGVTRRG